MARRPTRTDRELRAGCFACSGAKQRWEGPAAQGNAARHHDATGHQTWCEIDTIILYGEASVSAEQLELEAAIAARAPAGAELEVPF